MTARLFRERIGMRAGLYAVSAHYVVGLPHAMRLPLGTTCPAFRDQYAYFQRFPIADRAGQSIFIYDLTAEMIRRVGPR